MKTHLANNDTFTECGIFLACTEYTYSYEIVTCENCKRTAEYKRLKAEQKRNDVEELKQEPQTYKQTVSVEINVPIGYEFDKIEDCKTHTLISDHKFIRGDIWLKPKVKTGAELVGCLCGLCCTTKESAKDFTDAMQSLGVVYSYREGVYYSSVGSFTEAYPVSATKLKELIERAEG